MRNQEPVQLTLPFDGKDNGIRVFEVYTYLDRINKTGYEGHIKFIVAKTVDDASHRVAFDFPRFWLWCGVQQVSVEYLKKKINSFEGSLTAANEVLREVEVDECKSPVLRV